jgi:hypothetical protein
MPATALGERVVSPVDAGGGVAVAAGVVDDEGDDDSVVGVGVSDEYVVAKEDVVCGVVVLCWEVGVEVGEGEVLVPGGVVLEIGVVGYLQS